MLDGYDEVWKILGDKKAPDEAAMKMYNLLNNNTTKNN